MLYGDRYVSVASEHAAYREIEEWWTKQLGRLASELRVWIFLATGGTGRLFDVRSWRETDLDAVLGDEIVGELTARVQAYKSKESRDVAWRDIGPTLDSSRTATMRGDDVRSRVDVSRSARLLERADFGAAEIEAYTLESSWSLGWTPPTVDRQGPMGAHLSHTYYRLLQTRYGVERHLYTIPREAFYVRYATDMPSSALSQLFDGVTSVHDAIEDIARRGGAAELNLVPLGVYYRSFLEYVIRRVFVDSSKGGARRLFVAHARGGRHARARASVDVEGISLEIFDSNDRWSLSESERRTLSLVIGAPRAEEGITLPFVNDYERTYLIGARAEQIARGAKPAISVAPDVVDPFIIAATEFRDRVIPLTIRRMMPNGDVEYLNPNDVGVTSHASRDDIMI